jgi:hypothetical protein
MRFGKQGLPELVHEFPIDPPAVPFISDKSLAHRPLAPHASSLTPYPSASGCGEKPQAQCPSPPVGAPFEAEPSAHQSLNSPHRRRLHGSLSPWGGAETLREQRMLGGGRAGQEGIHREPQLLRGSRDCALPSAPRGPPVTTCSLSRSPSLCLSQTSEAARRGGGRPAGALCKSWCWVGGSGGGEEKKGK